jgi:hypothetical protein
MAICRGLAVGTSVALSAAGANTMDDQSYEIMTIAEARRALTKGDIRSDVAFQHDVNRLLATLDDLCDEPATLSRDA